jgi:hypothetical protein
MSLSDLLKLISVVLAAIILWSPIPGGVKVNAQTATPSPSPTPESEELRAACERAAILEQQKNAAQHEGDIAKAEKEGFEARFPKPSATPLEGKTDVDAGVKIESEIVAYAAISQAADRVVADIKAKNLTLGSVLIHNDRDMKALIGYSSVMEQSKMLGKEYERLLVLPTPAPTPAGNTANVAPLLAALPAAASVLGSFVDLVALFRTDTTVKGMSFDIEEGALVSEIFRSLRRPSVTPSAAQLGDESATGIPANCGGFGPGLQLYYPAVFPPNINAATPFKLFGEIEMVYERRAWAEKLLADRAEQEKALDETKGEINKLKRIVQQAKDEIDQLDREIERLQKIYYKWPSSRLAERIEEAHGKIDQLKRESAKATAELPVQQTKLITITAALNALNVKLKPEDKEGAVVRLKLLNTQFDKLVAELVKVDSAVGLNALRQYLQAEHLQDVLKGDSTYWLHVKVLKSGGNNKTVKNLITQIFRGDLLSHSGGAIVEYNLYTLNGDSKASNTFTEYYGYQSHCRFGHKVRIDGA